MEISVMNSAGFSALLKDPAQCTKTACPSGAYFINNQNSAQLYDLGTIIGGPQNTLVHGQTEEWSNNRFAVLIGTGKYQMNSLFKLNYYTQVLGVGEDTSGAIVSPGINVLNNCEKTGDANCKKPGGLDNFWRSIADLKMDASTNGALKFAVSQASPMRDIEISGQDLLTCDWGTGGDCGMTSGGFMNNVNMNGKSILLGSQQQFYISNSKSSIIQSGVWNIVSNNNVGTFKGTGDKDIDNKWDGYPFTKIDDESLNDFKIPRLIEADNEWKVTYDSKAPIPIDNFIVLSPTADNQRTDVSSDTIKQINQDLQNKQGIVVMPGIYNLGDTIQVPDNKIVLGLGLPSLVCPTSTGKCMEVDNEGVRITGIIFDAAEAANLNDNTDSVMLTVGQEGAGKVENPDILQDVYCRIARTHIEQTVASAYGCIKINADYVIGENLWLWRADHDAVSRNVLWTQDQANYGLIVNGNDVKMYGLFIEHFQNYQTVWTGKNGEINFYQSEMPYFMPDGNKNVDCLVPGSSDSTEEQVCASLYIAKEASGFKGTGMGVYSYFPDASADEKFTQNAVIAETAILINGTQSVTLTDIQTHFLDGDTKSGIASILMDSGTSYPPDSSVTGARHGYALDHYDTNKIKLVGESGSEDESSTTTQHEEL
jgi:hypothetical protein